MKYLFVIVVLLVGVWLWRNKRRAELQDRQSAQRSMARPVAGPDQPATEVVACAVCAVHLPRPEALRGVRGLYCSDAHRRQAEG
jgi:uncharacterized protein